MTVIHEVAFQVRDYECDLQGVVNNAVYQNYLEHARHEFLKQYGLDFAALTRARVNLVVIRAELDYKNSLASGNSFVVRSRLEQVSRVRFAFHQQVIRMPDEGLMLAAVITVVGVNEKGRPYLPDELRPMLNVLQQTEPRV